MSSSLGVMNPEPRADCNLSSSTDPQGARNRRTSSVPSTSSSFRKLLKQLQPAASSGSTAARLSPELLSRSSSQSTEASLVSSAPTSILDGPLTVPSSPSSVGSSQTGMHLGPHGDFKSAARHFLLPNSSSSSSSSSATASHKPSRAGAAAFVPEPLYENHPFSEPLMPPSTVISSADDDEDICPICTEALSFRLQGEKPHVIPSCGHKLHNDCFETVYGSVVRAKSRGVSVGMCGICRSEMRIGDDIGGGRSSKGSKLIGDMGMLAGPNPFDSHKMRSISNRMHEQIEDRGSYRPRGHSPQEDDDIVQVATTSFATLTVNERIRQSSGTNSTGSTITGRRGSADTMKGGSSNGSTRGSGSAGPGGEANKVVVPILTVRSEHSSLPRCTDPATPQHLTCMVTIEVPPRFPLTPLAGPVRVAEENELDMRNRQSVMSGPAPSSIDVPVDVDPRPASPTASSVFSAYAYCATPATPLPSPAALDLRTRMADWKGHSPDDFGTLKLNDTLRVRKGTDIRDFIVYLFDEAILCVTEDKRSGITGKIVEGISPSSPSPKLRLKGRVYARHISSVVDSSTASDLSVTILMSDNALPEFCMLFKNKADHHAWKTKIDSIVAQQRTGSTGQPASVPPPATGSASLRSRGLSSPKSSESMRSSDYGSDSTRSLAHSSAFSGHTRTTAVTVPSTSTIQEEGGETDYYGSPTQSDYPTSSSGYSGGLSRQSTMASGYGSSTGSVNPRNISYTPLDLVLVLSVNASGMNKLKTSILRNALDFLVHNLGPRTRLCLVTYSVGDGLRGQIHKTPFIALGTDEGRTRFNRIISELGSEPTGMIEHREERVNVVAAVNVAFDIVLQRKAKSALTGMVVMNDGPDASQKHQMEVLRMRSEAAKVPIHTIGWGRSTDPQSLWLLSASTGGSQTYCRGFYELQQTLIGVVGGILSIAVTNLIVNVTVPEKRWFQVRKVNGTYNSIIAADGTGVHFNLGELRYGERREILLEVEMTMGEAPAPQSYRDPSIQEGQSFNTATDAFFMSNGINPGALSELQSSSFYEEEYDGLPDEVPLFEVNASYRDPAAGKTVSRLKQIPTLLTITLTPPNANAPARAPPSTSPEIIRRRMELLVSDMLGRVLIYMTRRQDALAQRILTDTKRIIQTIMATLAPSSNTAARRRMSYLSAHSIAYSTLQALDEDVAVLLEGTANRESWQGFQRYMVAQHAVILREQKAWTPYTAVERNFFTSDISRSLVEKSKTYVSTRVE